MRALVVYESMFGNTRDVAYAVAEGLRRHMDVDVVEVGAAPTVLGEDVALLVVGAPTQAFGLSRRETRGQAAVHTGRTPISEDFGVRDWLGQITRPGDVAAATFDTRVDRPRVPGSAARKAERALRRQGFRIVAPAESFRVHGIEGPLLEGESDHARRWGEEVAARVAEPVG